MPLPELQFPALGPDPLETVWEAVKQLLRADPNLKAVRTLRLWEGDPDDAAPPTAAAMPWVRVTPLASPVRFGDEASWRVEFLFKYELAVAGTRIGDLLRLYGAFRGAFDFNAPVAEGRTAARVLRDAGASVHSFRTAALGPLRLADVNPDNPAGVYPIQNLASAGTLALACYIPAIRP
jgi:hypothetical protein